MYETNPLGVYISDCSKQIDFAELKAHGIKFVIARLGSGKDINTQYGIGNNKRYLDLGFAKVADACHEHGCFAFLNGA